MYLHRVFCSTPAGLELERTLFEEIVGAVNQGAPPGAGHLLLPVSVPPNLSNMEMFRPAIEQNVVDSEFFIQVFAGDWGLPGRDFKPYFPLALRALSDPNAPMKGLACAVSQSPGNAAISELKRAAESNRCAYGTYADCKELAKFFRDTLQLWLETFS
jgi:hypothetical protein